MSSGVEWEDTTLGAEVDLLTGFPFKSERYTDSTESIPLVRGDNIVQGAMRWEGVKRWPSSERSEHALYELQEGDVVLAMDRPWIEAGLKYAAISKHDLPCLLVQRTARLRGGPKLDTRFLRYLIGSREFTQHIHAITTGTAVPHISGRQIKDFTFSRPPLAEQKAIAAVLGALDDKIELNQRMNATLEAMARALFQSWFEDATQSDLPKGWREGFVSDLATLSRDGLNPAGFPDEIFDHYSIPAYDEGQSPKPEPGSTIKSNKFCVTANSVLVSKLNPRIPRIWLPELSGRHRAICSTEFLVTIPRPGVSREYLFGLFKEPSFVNVFATMVTGTSGSHQRVKPDSLLNMRIAIPPPAVMQKFTETTAPMFARINKNIAESRTLATLRDTLLPKLLSGEIASSATNPG